MKLHDEADKTVYGKLFVVATPIGNLKDMTFRAIEILKNVSHIAAEDTRHSQKLLTHYGITGKKLISYHTYNEKERTPQLIREIQKGRLVALLSNAGTPFVSDPGYRLIRTAVEQKIDVVPIPGVSAVITAFSISGLPVKGFVFLGFLSKKKGKRLDEIVKVSRYEQAIVLYESPNRVLILLNALLDTLGDRNALIAREMTKIHEEVIRGTLSELITNCSQKMPLKGEFTIVIEGYRQSVIPSCDTLKADIKKALADGQMAPTHIAKRFAKQYGLPKKEVYQKLLALGRPKQ